MNQKHFRERIFQIIEPGKTSDRISRLFDKFILTLIALSVLSVILESFPNLADKYSVFFSSFEVFTIIVFTIEYILRIYTANFKYPADNELHSIIKYIFSPMAIIDLVAILPFYLPLLIPIDLRFIRILRFVRIIRIFKINRYTRSLILIRKVLVRRKEELLLTIFITFLLLVLSASIMYYIESKAQPEAFPNIIASFWWAIATITTVGYGDIYPITMLGKILSGIIALLGIGIVALPTGIISSGFIEELSKIKSIKTNKKIRRKLLLYNYHGKSEYSKCKTTKKKKRKKSRR